MSYSTTTNAAATNDLDTQWGRADEMAAPNDAEVLVWSSTERTSPADVVSCDAAVTTNVDIAIIGGGLVGLALAAALQHRGFADKNNYNIHVYEQAPQLRSNSQGILGIANNGQKALMELHPSIWPKIQTRGCERHVAKVTTKHPNGTVTEQVRQTTTLDPKESTVAITWHNLQQILASLVDPTTIHSNHKLRYYRENGNSIELVFSNPQQDPQQQQYHHVHAKIVVACDGLFSQARQQLLPHNSSPIFFGQLNWGTIVDTKLPAVESKTVWYLLDEGTPRWMAMINDGGNNQSFLQFRLADPVDARALSPNGGRGGLGLPGIKDALLKLAATIPVVRDTWQDIPEAQIFERSICGHAPAPTWLSPNHRLALVGDAAHGMHPNIGQGANSAFESAVALVNALMELGMTPAALQAYEQRRKPRADLVQRFSNFMGVYQASGTTGGLLSRSEMDEMIAWIRENDDGTPPPPPHVLQVLQDFDPCEHPGVQWLWKK